MRCALLLLFLFAGCSSSMPPQDPATTATVRGAIGPDQALDLSRETVFKQIQLSATRARVWNELLGAHAALGFEAVRLDQQRGQATFQVSNRVRTIANKPASRYLDCGRGPAGSRTDTYRLTMEVTHVLSNERADVTTLQTGLRAWARHPGTSADPVPCSSLGLLETEINGIVMARTQASDK